MNIPARSFALEELSVALPRRQPTAWVSTPSSPPPLDPWLTVQKASPQLVSESARFASLLAHAGDWAHEITLCLNAPKAGSEVLMGVGQLSRWSVKTSRIYLRHAESTDSAVLRQLHEAALTYWVEGGGKQVASQLFLFVRDGQARVLFSHLPLERAANGAAFGTLLCFSGGVDSDFARACIAQVDSCSQRCNLPLGSEVDELLASRCPALLETPRTESASLRIVSEEQALGSALQQWITAIGGRTDSEDNHPTWLQADLGAGWVVGLRPAPGGFRLKLQQRSREPFTLSLCTGEAWAAGNCLLLADATGVLQLVWRGGLLGHCRWKQESLWLEANLPQFVLTDRGLDTLVASMAHSEKPVGPQLVSFAQELQRLAAVFAADAPPSLGHALADFANLSSQQQAQLAWSALIGLGAQPLEQAVLLVAQGLRDQGSLRFEGALPGPEFCETLRQVLRAEVERNLRFDSPEAELVRAIQPDLEAFVEDDWLHCALKSLPAGGAVSRSLARHLSFEYAEQSLGLFGWELRAGGLIERVIDSALARAVDRGLLARVGAGSLRRLTGVPPKKETLPVIPCPSSQHATSFAGAWSHELGQLTALHRLVLTSREGWNGAIESRQQLAGRLALREERIEQLEIESWAVLEQLEPFCQYLHQRLERALSAARYVPLSLLLKEDPWWRGVEPHLLALPQVFERLLAGKFYLVVLPDADATAAPLSGLAVSRFSPAELSSVQPLNSSSPQTEATTHEDSESCSGASEARLRLQDALRSVFRVSQKPLPFGALLAGTRKRIEVQEAELQEALCSPPFVQLSPETYGSLSRDIPGGHAAIACTLRAATVQLQVGNRALLPEQVADLAARFFSSPGRACLVMCLLRHDPSLHVSPSGQVTLAAWHDVALVETLEPLRLALPALSQSRFELLALAETPTGEDSLRRAEHRLRCLEQDATADDELLLCEARELVSRFVHLVSFIKRQSRSWTQSEVAIADRLARAAIGYFAEDNSSDDEDDLERGPLVRPQQMADCRSVLESVLSYLRCEPWGTRAGL